MLADDELKRQAEERVGTVLDEKWRLDSLLGVGGMASVYAATHRNTKRAAIKMLHPHLAYEKSIRERFLREGYAANQVKHPGVVAVHDEDTTADGGAFLVMELLEGEGVGERWRKHGFRLTPEEVITLADQLLDTLSAAHEKGVVHRDIKPENLFLTGDGRLKVLDFGIARLRELSGSLSTTRTGSMLGTPAFMAPEQAKGRWSEVDAWTDLWAVGATMFTLLTGDYVHMGNTPNEILALTITQPARSIRSVLPALHPALAAVVDRALAYQKHERWPDARAMQSALRAAGAEIERSGPFVAEPVRVVTHYDATLPQRAPAHPDAPTLPADRAPGDAATLLSAGGATGRSSRRRLVLAVALGGVVLLGAAWALLRAKAGSEPSGGPLEAHVAAEAVPAPTPSAAPSITVFVGASPPEAHASAPELAASEAPLVRPQRPLRPSPAHKASEPEASKAPKPAASSDPFARRR